MADLVIEREVLIEAPVQVVWRTVTEPDQMSLWFADRVELAIEPGAHGYMGFGDQGGPVVVETVEPPTRFSFRWNHPRGEEPVTGNSMLVEFTLTPEGDDRTRLRVVGQVLVESQGFRRDSNVAQEVPNLCDIIIHQGILLILGHQDFEFSQAS